MDMEKKLADVVARHLQRIKESTGFADEATRGTVTVLIIGSNNQVYLGRPDQRQPAIAPLTKGENEHVN